MFANGNKPNRNVSAKLCGYINKVSKAILLQAMQVLDGNGDIIPTHS
jgi:hypothetical protein